MAESGGRRSQVADRTRADPPTLVALHRFRRESWAWGIALPVVVTAATSMLLDAAGAAGTGASQRVAMVLAVVLSVGVGAFMGRFWLYRRIEGLVQRSYADAAAHERAKRGEARAA